MKLNIVCGTWLVEIQRELCLAPLVSLVDKLQVCVLMHVFSTARIYPHTCTHVSFHTMHNLPHHIHTYNMHMYVTLTTPTYA